MLPSLFPLGGFPDAIMHHVLDHYYMSWNETCWLEQGVDFGSRTHQVVNRCADQTFLWCYLNFKNITFGFLWFHPILFLFGKCSSVETGSEFHDGKVTELRIVHLWCIMSVSETWKSLFNNLHLILLSSIKIWRHTVHCFFVYFRCLCIEDPNP